MRKKEGETRRGRGREREEGGEKGEGKGKGERGWAPWLRHQHVLQLLRLAAPSVHATATCCYYGPEDAWERRRERQGEGRG